MAESTDDDLFGPARDAELTRVELELAETKLGQFLDLIPAGLLIHQRQGVIFANNEVSNIFLLSTEELVGRHFLDFIPDDQYDDVKLVFDKCFNERRTIRGLEIKLGNRNGKEIIVQVSMSPLFWEGLPVINILTIDISDLKEKEQALYLLSTTDSLTGTLNRRRLFELFENQFYRYKRYNETFSLLAMDIDYFKKINDVFGHGIGDKVLKEFVSKVSSRLRMADAMGRMGGEEFSILLPDTNIYVARTLAEDIRHCVSNVLVESSKMPVSFTVSIGVAEVVEEDSSVDTILNRADVALYRAKQQGRNRVEVA